MAHKPTCHLFSYMKFYQHRDTPIVNILLMAIFCATMAELNNCNRHSTFLKAYIIYYKAFYRKNLTTINKGNLN